MSLAAPWALLLLLPAAWAAWARARGVSPYGFGTLAAAQAAGRSRRQAWNWLSSACHAAGLAGLVVALARPRQWVERVRQEKDGIAIQLLLDTSSSMDEPFGGQAGGPSRLEAAKQVLNEFVMGNAAGLPGRPQDLVGLITFARFADAVSPMTLNHKGLAAMIADIHSTMRPGEDATAFGDAVALGAARLKLLPGGPDGPKSRVVVLATDGENNAGRILPLEAAALAQKWGIRLDTIILQRPQLTSAPTTAEETLRRMADLTGGVFRHAADADALGAVYRQIDSLEKSPVSAVRTYEPRERFAWAGLPALLLLALGEFLACLVFRQAPA